MDGGACRRAAVESLSENLTDGFVSPVFWYVLAGLPGLVLFKVVSTMDSMVGYKTPRYLRFGWCGARLDDVDELPAGEDHLAGDRRARRAAAGVLGPEGVDASACVSTGCCWGRIPAGAKPRPPARSSGRSSDRSGSTACRSPISGLATPSDPPLETARDMTRAVILVVVSGVAIAAMGSAVLLKWNWMQS